MSITDISSKAVVTVTLFMSVGLTISFILYAWLIMRGAVDMPVSELLKRCIRIITSIAFITGLYFHNEYA